jgi:acetyl esterase
MRNRKPIDPALKRVLDERAALEALEPAPSSDLERALATRAGQLRALQRRGAIAGLPNDVVSHDVALSAALAGRIYLPAEAGPRPLIVHLHGGGWVAGSLASHDPFCRLLARAAAAAVLAVDYRLAPEHPFPAALEDAATALAWAAREADTWSCDARRIVLSGDSAGANLAAVLANRLAHAEPAPRLAGQVLLYPVTDHPSGAHASYGEPAHGFGAEFMHWAFRQYAAHVDPDDPALSPLRQAQLPRLPPTFVATAEYDILRDEAIAYVAKLRAAGVAVTHHHAADMHHNFMVSPATVARFPQCDAALAALSDWLRVVQPP